MGRAFTAADVTHHNSDTVFNLPEPGVAFGRGAVEGRAGLLVVAAHTVLHPPFQWHDLAYSGITASPNDLLAIMARPGLLADESSWAFKASGTAIAESDTGSNANWVWIAEELANVSPAAYLASAETRNLTTGLSSISTGTTGTWSAPYALGIAAVMVMRDATSTGFPDGASWSNGFEETDVLTLSEGAQQAHIMLRVARKYGTLDETGPWETTCTFTGSMTGNMPFACLAVLRAEAHSGDI